MSCGSSTLDLLRYLHTVFHSGCAKYIYLKTKTKTKKPMYDPFLVSTFWALLIFPLGVPCYFQTKWTLWLLLFSPQLAPEAAGCTAPAFPSPRPEPSGLAPGVGVQQALPGPDPDSSNLPSDSCTTSPLSQSLRSCCSCFSPPHSRTVSTWHLAYSQTLWPQPPPG